MAAAGAFREELIKTARHRQRERDEGRESVIGGEGRWGARGERVRRGGGQGRWRPKERKLVSTQGGHGSKQCEVEGRRKVVGGWNTIASPGKGILAADESTGTIGKRFSSINVENTEENRIRYRKLLFSTPGMNQYISGVICYDETLRSKDQTGTPLIKYLQDAGIVVGIKVDKGLEVIPGTDGETSTKGLDGLAERCKEYYDMGARFAKWRAVYKISAKEPSDVAIKENAWALARYGEEAAENTVPHREPDDWLLLLLLASSLQILIAVSDGVTGAICQNNGLVPIIEPEILMDGDHDIERTAEVTEKVQVAVYQAIRDQQLLLEGTLLKPNMVCPGSESKVRASPMDIAAYTIRTLQRCLPVAVPGIVFLSGGQSEEEATLNLNAMNAMPAKKPWALTFSYGRALQQSCLKAWKGEDSNLEAAQNVFLERCRANGDAQLTNLQLGKYAGGSGDTSSLFQANYKY
eukprot:765207-Hanusia_phi.AAC.3